MAPFLHVKTAGVYHASAGDLAGAFPIAKFGSNPDVATGTYELISRTGPDHTIVYANAALKVASTDANDTAAGTGARTVTVTGVDEDFAVVTETVTLNGTTEVALASSMMLPYRLRVATSGTTGVANAGTIWIGTGTFTAGVPAVKHGQIAPPEGGQSFGQSEMALFAVRAGHTGFLSRLTVSSDADARFVVFNRTAPGFVQRIYDRFEVGAGVWTIDYAQGPIVIPEKTIIGVMAQSTSGGTDYMSASMCIVEVAVASDGKLVRDLTAAASS